MTFREQLNEYLLQTGASQADLAVASGLSASTVSRYRSGERSPSPEGDHLGRLANGLYRLSEASRTGLGKKEIYDGLRNSVAGGLRVEYSDWLSNLNFLLASLGISGKALSAALGCDPSMVSRILSGNRKPADLGRFTEETAAFVVRSAVTAGNAKLLTVLLHPETADETSSELKAAVIRWLGSNETLRTTNPLSGLLEKLDRFEPKRYLTAVKLDDVRLTTGPKDLPPVRQYDGIRGYAEGRLDFVRATLLSRSQEECILYSDFSFLNWVTSVDSFKHWVVGLSLLLKKGLPISILLDADRPVPELAILMEGFLPILMTGQVTLFSFASPEKSNFCHDLKVSGAAVFEGLSIRGKQEEGRFTFTKRREDLLYFRRQAEYLREKSVPLMEVYRKERKDEYHQFLSELLSLKLPIRFVTASLPIFLLPAAGLEQFLRDRDLTGEQIREILDYRDQAERNMAEIMEENVFTLEFPDLSEEAFLASPLCLNLSGLFFERDVLYSYELYDAHRKALEQYAAGHPNLVLVRNSRPAFRNLTYSVVGEDRVIISKNTSPAIHFSVRDAHLVRFFRLFIPPIRD